MSEKKQDITFHKTLGTGQVMAVSFGLTVCVSTWGSTLLGYSTYGIDFTFSIILAALIYLLIATHYAELATIYPEAGSIRAYVENEFGNRLGTMASMIYVLSFAAGVSAEGIFFGYVLSGFVPGIAWWIWALMVTTLGLIVNLIGIKNVGKWSDYLLYFVIAVALLVGILSFSGLTVEVPNLGKLTTGFFTEGFAGVIGAFLLAMWLFAGFEVAAPLAEEIKKPEKSLPKGMFFAIIAIGSLNIIFGLGAYILIPSNILETDSAMIEVGAYIAGAVGVVVLFTFALLATIATVLANYSSVSRLLYGMAEKPKNMLPANLKWLHPKFRTPWKTLILYYIITNVLILGFGGRGMAVLVYASSFIWIVQYIIAIVTTVALRRKRPDIYRPYKVPGGGKIPMLSILGLIVITVFLVLSIIPPAGDIVDLYYGVGLILFVVIYGLISGRIIDKKAERDSKNKKTN